MNETEFHRLADAMLITLFDALEEADETSALDADYQDAIINLQLPSGKHYVISKHTASRQIWVSSPVSGGLHFSYDAAHGQWKLADGSALTDVLSQELHKLAAIEVTF